MSISQSKFSAADIKSLKLTPIDHKLVDHSALKIVKTLQEAGHTAYLVGGCVRDLLMGLNPKDYDISTTARPRQVKKLVRNTFLIGRRFRLALVRRGEEQYEVSTFRRGLMPGENPEELPDGDNIFGDPKQDANRRDYTCNALFYDPIAKVIIDHTGGINDLKEGWIKLIGKPEDRLPEDPIRILRAVRFAAKLSLQIEPELRKGLVEFADELKFSPIPRRREEFLKILRLKSPGTTFLELHDLGIIDKILPEMCGMIDDNNKLSRLCNNLERLDQEHRKSLDPSQLFGVLVWSIALASAEHIDFERLIKWIKSEKIQEFCKHELGIFNAELIHIEQAFKILPKLSNLEEFKRKGARKQTGLLNQKSFPLGLIFYAVLGGPDLGGWIEAFEQADFIEDLQFDESDEKTDR